MGSAFPRQCASYQTRLVYPQAFFFFIEHKFVCRSVDTNAFHTPLSIYSPLSQCRRYLNNNAISSIPNNTFTTLTALTRLWVPHVCFSWCFHVNPSPEFAGLPQSKMCTLCHKLFLGFSLWPRHFICLSSHSHVCVMMQDSLPVTCFFGNSLFPWDAHYPYILPSCLCQCELWRHLLVSRTVGVQSGGNLWAVFYFLFLACGGASLEFNQAECFNHELLGAVNMLCCYGCAAVKWYGRVWSRISGIVGWARIVDAVVAISDENTIRRCFVMWMPGAHYPLSLK